jgi:adenylate cyclase
VTVLFADVVHSMDIAATLGAERLREIMAELFNRSSMVVKRYAGTVDKFTGDGIMAVFGAPVALEDHALRACLAALDIQQETGRLAADVKRDDGVTLELRVGLNSGEVIAGEIGSGPAGYTAVGEQVGMAQRMESVAPPDGVMLSESTARLVEGAAVLGKPEKVHLKGSESPVIARRLMAVADENRPARQSSTLVGRDWELNTIAGILDQAVNGRGCVVGLVGPPGIGKSRMAGEVTAIAVSRGVEVFTTYCESHTGDIPFHVATRLLRDVFSISGLEDDAARASVRARIPEADPEDLLLLDDLLGIAPPDVRLAVIDPAARTRRLTALLNAVAVARATPAIFVIEDAHWIDQPTDAMLGEFAGVVPQTHSLVLATYRPEYHGALDRLASSHRIPLAPLQNSDTTALATELLGPDPSVATFVAQVAERVAGNPFFAEEIVRDLAERGVLGGEPGAYVSQHHPAAVRVPASLQAAIAARIDRIGPTAKRTLNAAAVIGLRFESDLLADLVEDVDVSELIGAELIDQVRFMRGDEYAFRHPLIRAVAYESQLKSHRSGLHRKLAEAIEEHHPELSDANAALIAEHLEAAGDLREAFGWHMRAGEWARFRDVNAAYRSWQRAREVADRMPVDDPDRSAMRIAPRVLICGSNWRVGLSIEETGFDELRDLCISAGDNLALTIGMAGMLTALVFHNRFREAARVASDCCSLLEKIADPAVTAEVSLAAGNAKFQAGEVLEALRLAQCAIDMADGDPTKHSLLIGSPLAFGLALRGSARLCLGLPGFLDDFDDAIAMSRSVQDTSTYIAAVLLKYGFPVHNGAFLPDLTADQESAEALERTERVGDDFARGAALLTRGVVLANQPGERRAAGLELLARCGDSSERHGNSQWLMRFVTTETAKERAGLGDLDAGIAMAREAVHILFTSGDAIARGPAVSVLVESLLRRRTESDLAEAQEAIERLATVPVDPGFVLYELPLLRLRALLARTHGDEARYRQFADRYRTMANDLGFEGHMAIAETMQ